MTEATSTDESTIDLRATTARTRPRTFTPTSVLRRTAARTSQPTESLQHPSVSVERTWYTMGGKRAFDLVVAGTLLVLGSPLLAAVAIVVRLSLGKGVLFRQVRVGRNGEDFEMLKFRTMQPDRRRVAISIDLRDGAERRVAHKRCDDPRHTRVGRVLRRYSIDELPQLLNVIRGEMSLVGPRPELAGVVDKISARSHGRHLVRPGITGAWQVSQRQEGRPLAEDFDADLSYVASPSLRTDCSIIVRTFSVVFAGSGR